MNLAIFISGEGTNCENIIRYFADNAYINVSLVVSNKKDAYGLERAKALGIPTCIATKEVFSIPSTTTSTPERYRFHCSSRLSIDDTGLPHRCLPQKDYQPPPSPTS